MTTEQLIVINREQGKQQLEETLLHEVLHVIDDELKLGLAEEQITRLAVGIYSAGYRRK